MAFKSPKNDWSFNVFQLLHLIFCCLVQWTDKVQTKYTFVNWKNRWKWKWRRSSIWKWNFPFMENVCLMTHRIIAHWCQRIFFIFHAYFCCQFYDWGVINDKLTTNEHVRYRTFHQQNMKANQASIFRFGNLLNVFQFFPFFQWLDFNWIWKRNSFSFVVINCHDQ